MNHVNEFLRYIRGFTIKYFIDLKEKYGKFKGRKTEIRNFDQIEAAKVVAANRKLYVNREEGFFGFSLKGGELVSECSDIDDIVLFMRDGSYMVKKVEDKAFAGKDIIHIDVYNKGDMRTIYNVIYRDGKEGRYYIKRFPVSSVTRDKVYDLTKGTPDSKVVYLTANPNGEAEIVRVLLKPKKRLRNLQIDFDFSEVSIKGRNSQGNILTKNSISKIQLKESGISTLGGIRLWFDHAIKRLNNDGRGEYLGEFSGEDRIIEITRSGTIQLYNYDISNHFSDDTILLEKYEIEKIYTAVYYDGDQGSVYLKRFRHEPLDKRVSFIGDNRNSKLFAFSDMKSPEFYIEFGGKNRKKKGATIKADDFIAVKGIGARGKRVSPLHVVSASLISDKDKNNENPDPEKDFSQKSLFSPKEDR